MKVRGVIRITQWKMARRSRACFLRVEEQEVIEVALYFRIFFWLMSHLDSCAGRRHVSWSCFLLRFLVVDLSIAIWILWFSRSDFHLYFGRYSVIQDDATRTWVIWWKYAVTIFTCLKIRVWRKKNSIFLYRLVEGSLCYFWQWLSIIIYYHDFLHTFIVIYWKIYSDFLLFAG